MIVEDDISIADLLRKALERDRYEVTGLAHSVKDGARLAEETEPDFAVVDIHLADGRPGTELGERLRRETGIQILYSTGNSTSVILTTNQGHAVMTKPYLLHDVRRGLEIIEEIAASGRTSLPFPRSFRLLEPAVP